MFVAMAAAAVFAAGVPVAAMLVIVVVAAHFGVVREVAGKQGLHSRVCTAAHAAVQLDARVGKRRLCAASNAAANEHIDPFCMRKPASAL